MKNLFLLLLLAVSSASFGQVKISESASGSSPVASAVLEVESTIKGLLPPRMTTAERNGIASPAAGLLIYNTEEKHLQYYNGSAWTSI